MHRIPAFLRNKYVLAGLLFSVWILALDSNNLFIQWELSQEVRALEDGVEYYRGELERTKRRLNELESRGKPTGCTDRAKKSCSWNPWTRNRTTRYDRAPARVRDARRRARNPA
jgi:hypothetical protein